MTDRLKGCIVAFEKDIREDDAEFILNAIKMIKFVKSVEPKLTTSSDWWDRQQTKHEVQMKLFDVINNL